MSLAAETTSTVLDDAVKAAYNAGILSIAAAGNENSPIAPNTPARVPEAFTVGMTQSDRARVSIIANIYGSNYGPGKQSPFVYVVMVMDTNSCCFPDRNGRIRTWT